MYSDFAFHRAVLKCCLLLLTTFARAQEFPHIRNFSPTDYNAQAQNWSVTQAPEAGWMYFANNEGLLLFDGARWEQYTLPEKQTLRTVAAGPDGRVYGGGFAAFGYWQPGPGGLLEYQSLSRDVQSDNLLQEEIWHILALKDQVLFQSFSTIYIYKNDKITVLKPPGAIMFVQEVAGRLLVQVIGRGIYELLPDHSFRWLEGSEVLADKIVQFIIPDPEEGGWWAGTAKDGIWTWQDGRLQPWKHPLNQEFKRHQLNKAILLSNGNRVIGTILNGLYILDNKGNLGIHLNRETGLQNNTVVALQEDRDHNIWVGMDQGIDFLELNSPLLFFNDQSGNIGTVYTAALQEGRLYVGTNQGVFVKNRLAPNTTFRLIEGTQGQAWQLQTFDNQLLCGHNDGTFLIRNEQALKISGITGGWRLLRVPGQPDALLESTYTGLVVFRKGGNGWILSHQVEGFRAPLRTIAFDSRGYLWGAHPNKGLFRLRLSDDLKQVLELKTFTTADGLDSEFRIDLAAVKDHLFVLSEKSTKEIRYDQDIVRFQEAQPPFAGSKVIAGYDGDFFTLNRNIVQLNIGKQVYTMPVKLVPGYENIVALNESAYLFCRQNGYALLDKSRLSDQNTANNAIPAIRSVEFPGQKSGFSLPDLATQTLPNSFNSMRFLFAMPRYGQPVKYSWRLEGLSKEWSEWQTAPEKEFTNLPSGAYTLWLRTDQTDRQVSLAFSIAPPWYWSVWAKILYGLAALMLFYSIEQYNLRRLARQRRQLEEEKTRDMERQRAEAEKEKLSLELENKIRELSNAALGLIRKNEILQRIKDDLTASKGDPRALQKLGRLIDGHLESDHDWEIFENSFNQVHDDFFKRLMQEFSDLTPGDLRLAAYLKMNFSSKEIAPLFNISVRGVENKRYRLRKKLGLPEEANLTEFMMNY